MSPSPGRARWRPDARLLIGVLLVAGATAGVVGLVAATDDSQAVYVARGPLAPGDRVTAAELELRSARLDAAAGLYLAEGQVPDEGLIITRTVAAGELIPASAVGDAAGGQWTSVVLSLGDRPPAAVVAGSTVDVWAAREVASGRYGTPQVLVQEVTVVALAQSEGFMADSGLEVEVLVPRTALPRVLESVAAADVLAVIPVHLPLER